jgi:single-strand DNA-binding protein
MSLNKIHLIGRLGNDPVIKQTQKGKKVATFSLATQDFVKSKNENETTWHRIVLWGQPADFSEKYLKKGDAVYVDGSMKVRKYETDDGKTNYMHEIHSSSIRALGYRKQQHYSDSSNDSVVIELDEPHLQS